MLWNIMYLYDPAGFNVCCSCLVSSIQNFANKLFKLQKTKKLHVQVYVCFFRTLSGVMQLTDLLTYEQMSKHSYKSVPGKFAFQFIVSKCCHMKIQSWLVCARHLMCKCYAKNWWWDALLVSLILLFHFWRILL